MEPKLTVSFPAHWRHSRDLPPAIARELTNFAERMRGDQKSLPILLRTICSKLDIRIIRRKSVAPGKAYLEWNGLTGSSPLVLLPSVGNVTWDRFCTAHELGHYVLISKYGWHPNNPSDYWRTEVMCDYFARQLLIPDFALCHRAATTARSAMAWCNFISQRADVPWIQAAKKITVAYPYLGYLRLVNGKDGRLKVLATSLPLEKGRGTLVAVRADFTKIANDAMEVACRSGRRIVRALSRDHFISSKLGELLSEVGARDLYMEASAAARQVKISFTR
jgi:hypothetical protein